MEEEEYKFKLKTILHLYNVGLMDLIEAVNSIITLTQEYNCPLEGGID